MKSESIIQQEIRAEAAKHGIILMRNNVGAGKFVDENTGQESFVRFGLMNESKEQQRRIKSSDLIGIWLIPIGYGIFIAIEVKKEGWLPGPQPGKSAKQLEREQAQQAFIDFIRSKGGVAGFCTSVVDFLKLIGKSQ